MPGAVVWALGLGGDSRVPGAQHRAPQERVGARPVPGFLALWGEVWPQERLGEAPLKCQARWPLRSVVALCSAVTG